MKRPKSSVRRLLVVDVGNSGLRAARFEQDRLVQEWRYSYDDTNPRWSASWRQTLRQLHEEHGPLQVQIASVARRRAAVVQRSLQDFGFKRTHLVSHADAWPFEIDLEERQTVGIDRLANVAGAVALGFQSAIAIDLGTAITVDVLDAGVFRGGMIMPGLTLQARALHEHTSNLPLIDVQQEAVLVGRSTPAALLAGVTHMTLAGLAASARRLSRSLGDSTPILYTGGWAKRLRPFLRSARHEPHLLFLGLRERASYQR